MGGTVNFNWGEFCLISGQVSITSAQSRFQNPRSLDQWSGERDSGQIQKRPNFIDSWKRVRFPDILQEISFPERNISKRLPTLGYDFYMERFLEAV